MSSPEDNNLLNFIATTVENLRARIDQIGDQMATKVDLANLREQMASKEDLAVLRNELHGEIASLRDQMATKDDLALVATTVRGDFEQVHFRFDTLERVMATRCGPVETELAASAVFFTRW